MKAGVLLVGEPRKRGHVSSRGVGGKFILVFTGNLI